MKSTLFTTAIAGAATLAGASWAQSESRASQTPGPDFVSCETLLDATVTNHADRDNAADVDDLVVDTRSGRVVYAILDTNELLGSENKVVAVPYGALSWNARQKQFTIEATPEQLRNLPACSPDDLAHLQDPTWHSTLRGIFGDRPELQETEAARGDEYTWYFTTRKPGSMSGKIVAIDRQARTARGGTCCAVVVRDEKSGEEQTIFLAPVGHLDRESLEPGEGRPVSVTTIQAYDANGNVVHVAQTVRIDGQTIRLRDEKGVPAWTTDGRSFYALASKMDGGAVYGQGQEFGGVDDIVIEARSGTAAFAVASVGGMLGIDDTLYPIPCGALTMGRGHDLFVNMPPSKLKLAPKLSKDGLEDLGNEMFVKSVCDFYGVKPKRFDTERQTRWTVAHATSGR